MSEVEKVLRSVVEGEKVDKIKDLVEKLKEEGKSPDEIMEHVGSTIAKDVEATKGIITHTVKAII